MGSEKNRAEAWVSRICKESFFDLWSYPNPIRENKKELCDVLVVCHPDVIIFSVKEIDFDPTGDIAVKWERWARRAIVESAKQLLGAERWLKKAERVIRADGTPGVAVPRPPAQRIHRVAVALGGRGEVPIATGAEGEEFVHVFTEEALDRVLGELDTIEDLVQYLRAKEELFTSGGGMVMHSGESDLLAFYLSRDRTFPIGEVDMLFLDDDLWDKLSSREDFIARKREDEKSKIWDRLVKELSADAAAEKMLGSGSLDENELAIRTMARETRMNRRMLGDAFADFLEASRRREVEARMLTSPSGVTYVFFAMPLGTPRELRNKLLTLRCYVARGRVKENELVIGIATEVPTDVPGHSLDVCYLLKPTWDAEDEARAEAMKAELGLFAKPIMKSQSFDEYPRPEGGGSPER